MVYKSKLAPDEKVRMVLESLNTNISIAELCRKHAVSPPVFYSYRGRSSSRAGSSP
jgi:transposase-like protein